MSSRLVRFYVGANAGDELASADQFRVRAARAARVLDFYGVKGATIFPAIGVWEGAMEASMVVEVVLPSVQASRVRIADALRAEFTQNVVLVVQHPAASEFVRASTVQGVEP